MESERQKQSSDQTRKAIQILEAMNPKIVQPPEEENSIKNIEEK